MSLLYEDETYVIRGAGLETDVHSLLKKVQN